MILSEFLQQLISSPTLLITVTLVLGVVLVNGWTDAPNAIATCVSTRSISAKKAIIMAAVFNFFGVLVMTLFNNSVAQTIYNMVDFGNNPKNALVALCAALFDIVVWATVAWAFGIPTSESHALIAGITGAAIALQGGDGINTGEWIKVIYGLFMSSIMGFGLGYVVAKLIVVICYRFDRRKTNFFFQKAQVCAGAAMAFMHGAQDGQKFMGVIMALGTSIGGYKIIKTVGMGMVKLGAYQGFAADAAATMSLFTASALGIPVSTTHTKTTAIMGVGAAKRMTCVNWNIVKEMVAAWVLTFPGCGLLGYLMAYIFMRIF